MRGGKKLDPSDYFSHGIYRESRKKPPIRKEIIKEITIGLIIDENFKYEQNYEKNINFERKSKIMEIKNVEFSVLLK